MDMIRSLGLCSRAARVCIVAGVAWTGLLAVAPASMAFTQSLQVQAAPTAQATRPVAITATGEQDVPSTIAIYAKLSGTTCAGDPAGEAASGASLVDQRSVNGVFSYSVSFTPPSAGVYIVCTYAGGSTGGTVQQQDESFLLSVAPAPPTPPPSAPAPVTTPVSPSAKACTVPRLARHSLGGAQHLLSLAGCKLGRVYRPSARTIRAARRQAHGRTPSLVVASQTPAARAVRVLGFTVAVRLAVGPAPGTTQRRP